MKSTISMTFGVPVAVLPVIHVASAQQAREEAKAAFETGAHGVFMIDHGGSARATLDAAESAFHALHERGYDRPWIGVNLLGMSPGAAFAWLHSERAAEVRGVWTDTAGDALVKHNGSSGVWSSLWFGGVAFKYQPQPASLAAECARVLGLGADVLTTSGPATGAACDPSKVAAIRAAVGPTVGVGVASGVTPENAAALVAAGADALLVATGIARGKDFHRMDRAKLAALLAAVALRGTR